MYAVERSDEDGTWVERWGGEPGQELCADCEVEAGRFAVDFQDSDGSIVSDHLCAGCTARA